MSERIQIPEEVKYCSATNIIGFQGIRNGELRLILYRLLPLGLLAGASVVVLQHGFSQALNSFYISFLITFVVAVLLTIWLFKEMTEMIPSTMQILWSRGILAKNNPISEGSPAEGISTQVPLKDFSKFMADLEDYMNGRWNQILFGIFFAFIFLSGFAYEVNKGMPYSDILFKSGGEEAVLWGLYFYVNMYITQNFINDFQLFLAGFIVGPLMGFLLGLIAWRMMAVGLMISRLDKEFDLTPRLKDPDKCGGMEPLGNLCLYNAKIVGVWGAFLVLWIILSPKYEDINFFAPLLKNLLLLPVLLALASFFLPLWGVHVAMMEKKVEMSARLDQIARKINELARKRLDSACHLGDSSSGSKELSDWLADQEKMQNIYEESSKYPVWPINYQILIKFISTQALPLLGLTGLGGPILDTVKSLLNILSQSGGG